MRLLFVVLLGIQISIATPARASESGWKIGEYKLVNGQASASTLNIQSVEPNRFRFSLVALSCVNGCGDPENEMNNNGIVEDGSADIKGDSGTYTSANEEDDDLGHCVLHFKLKQTTVTVRQAGNCWWFGVGVNASGTYGLQHKAKTKNSLHR
jgi:hypothetical protein